MGRFLGRSGSFFGVESESSRPATIAYRHRVALAVDGGEPQIVWVTNDVVYARAIASRINALAGEERAWAQTWMGTAGNGCWIGRRKKAQDSTAENSAVA